MKNILNFTVIIPLLIPVLICAQPRTGVINQVGIKIKEARVRGVYRGEDHQYFIAPIADVRRARTSISIFDDSPVTNDSRQSHRFMDISVGGTYPFFGYHSTDPDPMNTRGVDFFIEPAVFSLLDLDSPSIPLVGSDIRLGFGIRGRSIPFIWIAKNLTWRVRIFAETSHIGDEFILLRSRVNALQHYNVSYSASDLFLSLTNLTTDNSFYQIYLGIREIYNTRHSSISFVNLQTGPFYSTSNEIQVGVDLVEKVTLAKSLFFNFLFPDSVGLSVDISNRSKLAFSNPSPLLNYNIVFRLLYGSFLKEYQGPHVIQGRSISLQVNNYNGVNPFGQFRTEKIDYWGMSISMEI